MAREYEMSERQLAAIMEACKPVPYIAVTGGVFPRSPRENANAAWAQLGKEMGFKYMTVKPISGKGARFFTACAHGGPSERRDAPATMAGEGD